MRAGTARQLFSLFVLPLCCFVFVAFSESPEERCDIEVEATSHDQPLLDLVDADDGDLDLTASERKAKRLVCVTAGEERLDDADPARVINHDPAELLMHLGEGLEVEGPEHRADRRPPAHEAPQRYLLEDRFGREIQRIAALRVCLDEVADGPTRHEPDVRERLRSRPP